MSKPMDIEELLERDTVCYEWFGSHKSQQTYFSDKSEDKLKLRVKTEKKGIRCQWTSLISFFRLVFLPQGFPHSVSCDYIHYQIWDTIQAFASSISSTLATQSVLKGVGVGDDTATAMGATITWLLKDGTSMVGRIMFAWLRGSSLDSDCKRWRLFADYMNDTAICLELIASMVSKSFFRLIVCVSGLCRALVSVAGGATRAALTQHQARRNNMADVSAKDGSQETLVNLAALLVSFVMIPLVSENQPLIWLLFTLCTILHLYANYRAVTAVVMETPNQARYQAVLRRYLSHREMLSVQEANLQESVLFPVARPFPLHLGVSVSQAVSRLVNNHHCCTSDSLDIVLHEASTSRDQLEALFQAEVVYFMLACIKTRHHTCAWKTLSSALDKHADGMHAGELVSMSRRFTKENFPGFLAEFQRAGYSSDVVQLGSDEWRANWSACVS
ncbi:PREDICTED: RUS1 family protein C16orf58 homolog [Priapulus caudatus]|uniref:RUS1 family protein C16orf58 homolog n=1 Tax=Priapulus caudatus TaxID=37621 RepID=A0ABM1F427_PRICU|nr:PREDICTED: RUS1 family protein C16orf58 homolog [Priapulus caudatus]